MSGFSHFHEIERDLVILLSVVNAHDQTIKQLRQIAATPGVPDGVMGHAYVIESTVENLLISAAVRLRMIEDRFGQELSSVVYPYADDEICRFIVGTPTTGDQRKTGLRRACDKIIHADSVSFYDDLGFYEVSIGGMARGSEWEVVIDTRRFALSGLALTEQYDDNWEVSSIKRP